MTMLKAISYPGWIQRSIELFFKHSATVFELRTAGKVVKITPMKYNMGLFHGDSLSARLFCLPLGYCSYIPRS